MFSAYDISRNRAEQEMLVQKARESIARKNRREARRGLPNTTNIMMEDAMDRVHEHIHFSEFIDLPGERGKFPHTLEQMYAHDMALIENVDGRNCSDDWKHVPLNRVLIPEEVNNIFGMINNGFTFMEVSDYTRTLVQRAREGGFFEYSEIMREKSEMSARDLVGLGDSQLEHQSSAPHEGSDELPPIPLSLYERFKKERDSLVVDKESCMAVRKLSKDSP